MATRYFLTRNAPRIKTRPKILSKLPQGWDIFEKADVPTSHLSLRFPDSRVASGPCTRNPVSPVSLCRWRSAGTKAPVPAQGKGRESPGAQQSRGRAHACPHPRPPLRTFSIPSPSPGSDAVPCLVPSVGFPLGNPKSTSPVFAHHFPSPRFPPPPTHHHAGFNPPSHPIGRSETCP